MTDRYSAELKALMDTRLGQSVEGIHLCPRHLFEQGGSALLESVGVAPSTQVFYAVNDLGYGPAGVLSGGNGSAFRGVTISTRQEGRIGHHVFIQSDKPHAREAGHTSDSQDLCIQQLLALTHELGHIQDMNTGQNFTYVPEPTVWLARAEAEAHAFCLEHFSSRGLTELRNLLAQKLAMLSNASSGHEKSLYTALCARIGKGRLKRWAAAA